MESGDGRKISITAGMVGLATKWVRLAQNGTNPGLFQIRFQCIWRGGAKCTDIWSEKAPDLSHLGPNLTHFGTKPTFPDDPWPLHDSRSSQSVVCIITLPVDVNRGDVKGVKVIVTRYHSCSSPRDPGRARSVRSSNLCRTLSCNVCGGRV